MDEAGELNEIDILMRKNYQEINEELGEKNKDGIQLSMEKLVV